MKTNPGPLRTVPTVRRLPYSNVRGLAGNLSDLTVASSRYDILLCSKTLISDMPHKSELLVPGFCWFLILSYAGSGCLGPRDSGIAAYVRDGFRVCGARQNLYEFSL